MRKFLLTLSAVFFLVISAMSQRTITGRVTNETAAPVQGVTITANDNSSATTTNNDGTFRITVSNTVKSLLFTASEYSSAVMNVVGRNVINVVLTSTTKSLEDVVVTGYGNKKKSEYAGASYKVTAKEIKNVPSGSFDQILQGKVPGLTVLSNSGQPGSSATVILRGPTSILGGSTPLYVIDGIPVEAGVFQSINPNDIESVDVLKDATATALYGSRGAAGVIVVATRRGQPGKLRVAYGFQGGVTTRPDFNYTMMNSTQLLQAQEDYGKQIPGSTLPGWFYSKLNPRYATLTPAQQAAADFTLDSLRKINTNWDDIFFRTGSFTNHDLSISGGQGKTRMFSSIGFYNEQGIIKRSDLTRITLRNNLDYAGDKFTASFSSLAGYAKRSFQESTTSNSTSNPFLVTRITPPYVTVLKPDGTPNAGTSLTLSAPTLLDAMNYDKNYSDQGKANLNANLNYKISNNWTIGALAGVDFRETQSTVYADPRRFSALISSTIRTHAGSISEALERNIDLTARGSLGYAKIFNEKHDVSITGYGEFIQNYYKIFSTQVFGIDPRTPNSFGVGQQATAANQLFPVTSGLRSQHALASALAVGKYTFNKKYTISGSYRYDGASILPAANRYHSFYSLGGVWDVKSESFIKESRAVNVLRLKLDYGTSANAENFPTGDFGYLATYASNISYNGGTGIQVTNPGNPDAQWEFTKQLDLGIDYAFLNNRLYGGIELYRRITDNLFAQQTLTAESGFGLLNVNAGSLSNKGIEWTVNYDVIKKQDFVWTLTALGSYNKNEITSLGQVASFEGGTGLYEVGKPVGSHYEVGWAGVDAATGKPLFYDKNGNLIDAYLSSERVTKWGTYFAPWNGSFSTTLRFKGFEFNSLFGYSIGSTRVNNLEYFVENPDFLGQGFNQATTLDFWKKPGDQSRVQSPLFGNTFNSKLIQSADFLRWRSATLSYNFPQSVVQKLKLTNIRFYVLGQNLITWTHWKGYDPEDNNNISLTEYPNPRTITGGFEITF